MPKASAIALVTVVIALAALIGAGFAIVFRHELRRRFPRAARAVSFGLVAFAVALAAGLLLEAVLLLDVLERPVNWLIEDALDLGAADEAGKNPDVVGWIRLLFVVAALAVLALVRALGRRIWLDVLAVTTVLVGGYALLDARSDTAAVIAKGEAGPVGHPPTDRAWVRFAASRLADPLSDYKSGEAVTLILVVPQRDTENKITKRTTSRYNVRLRSALKPEGKY